MMMIAPVRSLFSIHLTATMTAVACTLPITRPTVKIIAAAGMVPSLHSMTTLSMQRTEHTTWSIEISWHTVRPSLLPTATHPIHLPLLPTMISCKTPAVLPSIQRVNVCTPPHCCVAELLIWSNRHCSAISFSSTVSLLGPRLSLQPSRPHWSTNLMWRFTTNTHPFSYLLN